MNMIIDLILNVLIEFNMNMVIELRDARLKLRSYNVIYDNILKLNGEVIARVIQMRQALSASPFNN